MEECERKKKLKAGKEKLAAFQKKKSRKKKKVKDGDTTMLGIDVGEVSDVSSTSEMSSGAETQSNEDSDQQSLSGLSDDETPKEEGNLTSLLRLKAKLQSANQRIEELEECIMGKQLALDKVIVENEKLRKEVASERDEKLEGFELKESVSVTQESKHGLSSLESVNGDSSLNGEKGDLSDIQDLTQQVQWLQVQLKQAGMALQDQADCQSFSVQALQEAKSEILNLQQNVTQKDQVIYQLAEKLTQVSQQYSLLQRAHDSLKNEDKKDADSTFSITEVEVKLEELKLELETEHKKILNEMSNVLEAKKQVLDGIQNENEELKKACETSEMKLRNQREELEKRIAKLSEELMNAQANNEKLRQHLESVNQENRALLDEWDRTKTEKEEANFKIKFMEQQLKDSLEHMETGKLKLESLEIELLSEREEKENVNKELQKYKEEVMILKEEKEHTNLKIQHFIEENTSLKDEKEKANAERSLLQKQFEDFKESINSEFQSLTSHLNETLEQMSDVKSVNEVLSRELEKLKAERSGMLEQLDMYHSQVAEYEGTISQMHGLQEENQALRTQNDELYNKINNQKDIIVGLKAELDVLSVDNKQLGEQLQVFTSDLSHHQSEIDIIETERHAFTEEMENLQRHYMDLQSESEVYKSSTASLSQHIAELKQELSISTTDNFSQLDTRSSADDYQIADSVQRRMMPLEECTITPSLVIVTHEEIRESDNNTESAVLTSWTLDQAQSLESQNNIIEQQSQRVEEGMIVPDVSTVVTVHLDKTWEVESFLKESPDTPETSPTLSELAANHEDPSKSSLDQITLLADKIQTLYSILAAVSVQNLVSCSLAIDGNTAAQKDDSDAKIGSFMSSGDSVERKQDKDLLFMDELSDIERVRFENLRTGIQNLQKCLSSLNYSLEVMFPSSPRCSVTDEVGDPMPRDSPKQMMVTSLDDIGVKLEALGTQYEEQLEKLRQDLELARQRTGEKRQSDLMPWDKQVSQDLRQSLPSEQQRKLDNLLTDLDEFYEDRIKNLQQKHVEELGTQVKAMRITLEQIYQSRENLTMSELEARHQITLAELEETLTKKHKEELNQLEADWSNRMEDLKQDYDRELRDSLLEDSLVIQTVEVSLPYAEEEKNVDFIRKLNKKLCDEHKQLLQKISEDLEKESVKRGFSPKKIHTTRDSQTDSEFDDTESVKSAPVTQEEFHFLQERDNTIESAEDVVQTLEGQRQEITQLRSRLLSEYEQLLALRTEMMASQSQEVEKQQKEMMDIRQDYEEQMKTFQTKIETRTEEMLRSCLTEEHNKELERLKEYYGNKVKDAEESYKIEIQQLQQTISDLQDGHRSTSALPETEPPAIFERERAYVQKTVALTAVSDTEGTAPEVPPKTEEVYEVQLREMDKKMQSQDAKLKQLEGQLKEKDRMLLELQKRLEEEVNIETELHGKLLDDTKSLEEMEDDLKARSQEIQNLKKLLEDRDTRIACLEKEVEKGKKDETESESDQSKVIKELNTKIDELGKELFSYKEIERKMREEIDELTLQHQHALEALKVEVESINVIKHEEEIRNQAEELSNKYEQEMKKQADFLENRHNDELHKQAEAIKQKMNALLREQAVALTQAHEEEVKKLTNEYESKLRYLESTSTSDASEGDGSVLGEERMTKISGAYDESLNRTTDELRHEYEEKISELQLELEELKSKLENQVEQAVTTDESVMREHIRDELSEEFEETIEQMKQEYEEKLEEYERRLQEFEEKLWKSESAEGDSPASLPSEVVLQEIPKENEEAVEYIDVEYQQKIEELQSQAEARLESQGTDLITFDIVDSGLKDKMDSDEKDKDIEFWKEKIREELEVEYEENFARLKEEYDKLLTDSKEKLIEAQFNLEDSRKVEEDDKKLVDEVRKEYEFRLEQLKTEYESKEKELKERLSDMNRILDETKKEKDQGEKKSREKYQSMPDQAKKDYEIRVNEMRREYEEKMDLLREELQEMWEVEKTELIQEHKHALAEVEEKYESLIEGIRTGDAPEVASIIHEKYDTELDMAKTLMQQEFDEMLENEQTNYLEEQNKLIERFSRERAEDARKLKEKYEQELEDLRTSLKDQHDQELNDLHESLTHDHLLKVEAIEKEFAAQLEEARSAKVSDEDVLERLREEMVEMERRHKEQLELYEERIEKLQAESQLAGAEENEGKVSEDAEALEIAHQQEMQDLEEKLTEKHSKELDNLEKQLKSQIEELSNKHKAEIEALEEELQMLQEEARQTPVQEEMIEEATSSTHEVIQKVLSSPTEDLVETVVTSTFTNDESQSEMEEEEDGGGTSSSSQSFEEDDLRPTRSTPRDDIFSKYEEPQGQETGSPSGSLRGVDSGLDGKDDLITFEDEEEEEDSDKSFADDADVSDMVTVKSVNSMTPTNLLQTLQFGVMAPTVTSLEDSQESLKSRIRELEIEIERLNEKLHEEVEQRDIILSRSERDRQEGSNLVTMLRDDIEQITSEKNALQTTNEHLLSLLSNSAKTFMEVEETIGKKLKAVSDKSFDKYSDRPGSGGKRRDVTTPKGSPTSSPPARGSPGGAEVGEKNTSVLSNVTDEGLDLSQQISESIFHGPDLIPEEEELIIDAGRRLQSSVTRLLEMWGQSTTQLFETRTTQAGLLTDAEENRNDAEQLRLRCEDLEERLRDEVEAKDYLAMELHKAEGLIEGYSAERETLNETIQNYEENKEALVAELETLRSRLQDLEAIQRENKSLQQELECQRNIIQENGGQEAQALVLEVNRLSSEKREVESQMHQCQERYESRVRELETSGEDMEHHYMQMLDEKKQELQDLRLQLDSVEKQLKAKKQFIEEQSIEREQEREEFQKELDKWKKLVQGKEKQESTESRLQNELDDLSEQLQSKIDSHNQMLVTLEKLQYETKEKDVLITELKTVVHQVEDELEQKSNEIKNLRQKIAKLDGELSRRPLSGELLTDSLKLEEQSLRLKSGSYTDLAEGVVQHRPPLKGQMTVDKELRDADDKDKEELIQERDALQAQVEEQLIQISALRNQLDDMRHLTKFSDPSEAGRRLQAEREKTEELDNEISTLKQKIEELEETVANRDQQLQQLWSRTDSMSSHETVEERNEKQETIHRLEQQNVELKERVHTLQARTTVSNISGLSQSLLEEKNQEIDHLMEELRQAQADIQELQTEKGVSNLYKELESVKKQLYQSEKQLTELQQLQLSHSSETVAVDTSLTPDQSILGPRDSFSEKASIQQELEESVAHKLDRMINLEAEVKSLKKALQEKEEEIVSIKTKEASSLEDPSFYRDMIQEKELMITQLVEQLESLQSEVDNLTDFQNKLQEDFDTVQAMLEEKDKEIESLNTELTERSPEMPDEHELVNDQEKIKHEVEIARLKKALKEKDNVIEEKKEEIAELLDKLEQQELDIAEIKETKARLQVKERELEILASKLEKQEDSEDIQSSLNEKEQKIKEQEKEISYLNDELSKVQEHLQIAENLQRKLDDAGLVTSESITREHEREDEMKRLQAQVLMMQEKMKIKEVEAIVGLQVDETDTSESEKEDLPLTADGIYIDEESKVGSEDDQTIQEKDRQIALLKQQVAQALMIKPPTPIDETEKDAIIHEKEEEIEMLRKQVAQALMVKPPPPDDEIEEEIQRLKTELESLKESQKNRGQDHLEEKLEEVQGLKKEIKEKDQKIHSMEEELNKVLKELKEMEQELVSQKNLQFYEETLQVKEKDEEIQLLQDELESLREKSRTFEKSEMEKSDGGQNQDVHSLKRRMSFYEEQYEAKSAEVRELQVNLDIVREQLDKEKRSRAEEIEEEVRAAKEEMERKKRQEVKNLEENAKYLERERDQKVLEILELKRELALVKDRLERETEHKQKEMDELIAKMDKDRKENLASFQELEKALEDSMAKRRSSQEALMEVQQKLNSTIDQDNEFKTKILKLQNQIKDLEEEREQERNEYVKELQVRAKAGEVERLQKEIGTLQKQEERVIELQKQVKAIESEKEQYQAQIRQLEKDYDNLNTKRKLEVESLEEQIRTLSSVQPGPEVLQKLQVTQGRLDQTTAQLEETETRLAKTKEKLKQLSDELHRYKNEMQKLQQELGRTSTDLRETSIRLQETEQKLKLTADHMAEREEQIQRLQGELQQSYSIREWTKEHDDQTFRMSELQSHLHEKEQELEEVKQRLNEAVELSEEQLKHVEQKDQEFTKLKLDIQQMMAEKDKKLQDAKKQLQQATAEKEEEVAAVTQKMEELLMDKSKQVKQLQEQLAQLRSAPEGAGGDLSTTLATMKTQLQERDSKIKELQSEIKKLVTKLEQAQSVGQSPSDQNSQELTIEETEKQMQQLRRELLIAKTALKQLQKGSDLEGDQEVVEDEVTEQMVPQVARQPAVEARQNVSWLSEEDERSRLLEKLEQIKTELELLRSTSSMTARDFVQKVMDLKSELSAQHQQHIQDITQRTQLELERQLAQLHFKYEDQIQHQSLTHQKEMEQKLNELQRNLEREYKQEINKLKVRHQDEIELLQARIPDADSSAMDHVQQLQSEVALGQRLFRQRQDGVGQDKQKTSSPAKNLFPDDENISKRLQILLNRLHNEGVQVLTLSELEYLNRNMVPSSIPAEMDMETLRVAWENERQSLLSTIQSLKDLLAQTHKLRGLEKSFEGSDWRGELLRAIGYVFTKEREALFAELRSHVLSHPSTDVTEIQKLEQKIRNQESHQVAALDQIFSADRQSLLAEVRDLRAHATIMRMQHQEERDRLKDQFDNLEDQSTKKERQLKRQVQLLEFKIQQEKVLQEDLRTSLDLERHRTSDLSTALNKEKNTNLDLQSDYSGMQVQLARLRENLEREQSRFVSVTSALEEEKAKTLKLTEQLQDERGVNWKLKSEMESLQVALQQGQGKNSQRIETLQEDLKTEKEKRIQVETLHERDQAMIKSLRQEKERESHQLHALDADYQNKIKQLTASIETEKKKTAELASALDRERNLTASLRQSLEAERSIPVPSAQEQNIVEDLETELENQKALVHDLHAALEREKANFKNLVEASEAEKTLILEQLDQDKCASRQLKKELDQAQQQKLELTRKYENERDMVNQLKAERDQLTSDLKSLKEQANLKEHELDLQRIADKRTMRQAERDKEDIRVRVHEQELEIQRLKKRVIDLEDQVTESREKELEAIRELENEKLRNFTHSSASDRLSGSSHRSNRTADILDEEKKLQVYHSQLESICQSLQYLLLRCREQLSKSSHESHSGLTAGTDFQTLQNSLKDLMTEIRQLQELGDSSQASGIHVSGVNERILRHNEELTSFVSRISEEKTELRNTLTRLEEDIWRYRQMESKMKDLERTSDSNDDKLISERAAWAKERLSLQMALNKAERELEQTQVDLRVERARRLTPRGASTQVSTETDTEKIQRLYGKYLRAESFRKALIYQKKYLLLLLGGFQDTEETTLSLIARMGVHSSVEDLRNRQLRPLMMFRSAVRVCIAVSRMRYLVKKWRRAIRVGSEVVSGALDSNHGYIPQTSSYSPPRASTSSRLGLPHQSSLRYSDPSSLSSAYSQLEVDTRLPSYFTSSIAMGASSRVHTTPPTKDYSSSRFTPQPLSGARRKILSSSSSSHPEKVKYSTGSSSDRDEEDQPSDDEYISRLENLQNRLGNLQNGKPLSWKQPWR